MDFQHWVQLDLDRHLIWSQNVPGGWWALAAVDWDVWQVSEYCSLLTATITKLPQNGHLTQETFISHNCGGQEVQDQIVDRLDT